MRLQRAKGRVNLHGLLPLVPTVKQALKSLQIHAAHMFQEQHAKTVESAEKGRVVQPSLLKALYRAYGFPYLLLGVIKLINDILGFAGPLLLNLLIRYLETPPHGTDAAVQSGSSAPEGRWHWLPKPDSLGFGLLCAALLGLTSLVKVGTSTPLWGCIRVQRLTLQSLATYTFL